ncbi:hypothetical protein V5O48_008779, partial [Marasmius crinis-equi]
MRSLLVFVFLAVVSNPALGAALPSLETSNRSLLSRQSGSGTVGGQGSGCLGKVGSVE